MVVYKTVITGKYADIPGEWGWPSHGENAELSDWERHALGIIGASHASMLVGHVLGLVTDHGHFRAILALMEIVAWGIGGYDGYVLGVDFAFPVVLVSLAAAGLLAHSKEPGLFTKDKNSSSKKE